MSTTVHRNAGVDPAALELLRGMLEEAFAVHTHRLTELTVYARLPGRGGHDPRTLEALTAHHRQGIADAAHALRRMADGTYGTCRDCRHTIPLGLLHTTPHADRCTRCHLPEPYPSKVPPEPP